LTTEEHSKSIHRYVHEEARWGLQGDRSRCIDLL